MSSFRILTLLITLFLAQTTEASHIKRTSALYSYIDLLSEQVEQSASLVSLKFALPEATDSMARDCQPVNPARIVEFVRDLGSAILSSRSCDAVCSQAYSELRAVIDGREFLECRETETSPYAYVERTRFLSTDRTVAIDFELGYSD